MTEKKDEMDSYSQFIVGIVLILAGFLLLLIQSETIGWDNFWTLLIILIGIAFFGGYLTNHERIGLLMPGTILTIIGTLFFYLSHTNWEQMEFLWPTFILSPGIGFFLMYFADKTDKKYYIPAVILTIIAIAFFIRFWEIIELWPYILIGIGVYMVIKYIANKKSRENNFIKNE